MIRLRVDPQYPDLGAIARLAVIVRDGGVIAIPTDTLYGLAADPFNAGAVRRIFAIKRRDAERAVPLVAADMTQVRATFADLPDAAVRLADRFWPGPLTLLLSAPAGLAPEVTGGLATAGVRVPNHGACRALARACERPLTATSANVSGRDPSADPDEVIRQLGVDLDAILDAGLTAGGLPSTIVDVSGARDTEGSRRIDARASHAPTLVRAGAIDWKEIQACLLE